MRLDRTRTCPSHDPDNPVVRCDLARGHKPSDEHYAELGGKVYRWGPGLQDAKPTKAPSELGSSNEYVASEIFTDGIKAAMIADQLLQFGEVSCVQCREVLVRLVDVDDGDLTLGSPEYEAAFALALAEAMSCTDKHHSDRRRGHGYRPKKYGYDFGHDLPILIEAPLCKPCHTGRDSEIHPGPQLKRSAVS